jgi:hypothetical protein
MKPFYAKGVYVCQGISQALGETSNGNTQFVLRFKVLGAVDPDNADNYIPAEEQYERTYYRVINEKTIDYAIEDLKALGFDRESFKFLDPNTPGFQNFAGQVFNMFCKHTTYQGEPREEWGVARKGGALEVKPVEAAKVRQLDSLFAAQLKGLKKQPAQTKAVSKPNGTPPPPATRQVVTDDDVPF